MIAEARLPTSRQSVIVTPCERICFNTRKINLSHVFPGQRVGIRLIEDRF